MISTPLRWLAIIASAFVALSFVYFAVDQTSNASQRQVRAITGGGGVEAESATKVPNPEPAIERLRERENDGLHEFVDDVNDVLLSPFAGIYDGDNIWLARAIPAALALFLYGFLGLYLSRALLGRGA